MALSDKIKVADPYQSAGSGIRVGDLVSEWGIWYQSGGSGIGVADLVSECSIQSVAVSDKIKVAEPVS